MILRSFLKIEDSEGEKKRKSSNVSGARTKKKYAHLPDNQILFYIVWIGLNLAEIYMFLFHGKNSGFFCPTLYIFIGKHIYSEGIIKCLKT